MGAPTEDLSKTPLVRSLFLYKREDLPMLTFTPEVVALLNTPGQHEYTPSAAICVSTGQYAESGVLTQSVSAPPFSPDAPFIMYSVTKSLLATIALKLVAQHILDLDIPIERWLPAALHAKSITLRHLLRHAGGLPDYGGLTEYVEGVKYGRQPWPGEEFLAHTQAETLLFSPGQGWRYSNLGYMVVGQLLETVQSASFADIFQAEIVAPLGLTRTYAVTDDIQLAQLTFGPSVELEHPGIVAEQYHVGWIAHPVVASTVAEMVIFFVSLFDGHLLIPALLREMCTYIPLPFMPDRPVIRPGYGMGLQIEQGWPAGPIYGHSGGGPGARLSVISWRRAANPITVAVATTGEDIAQAEQIALEMLQQYDK